MSHSCLYRGLPTPKDKNYPEQIIKKANATGGLFSTPFQMLDAFFTAGPKNRPRHLIDSNIDWGQDLFVSKTGIYRIQKPDHFTSTIGVVTR